MLAYFVKQQKLIDIRKTYKFQWSKKYQLSLLIQRVFTSSLQVLWIITRSKYINREKWPRCASPWLRTSLSTWAAGVCESQEHCCPTQIPPLLRQLLSQDRIIEEKVNSSIVSCFELELEIYFTMEISVIEWIFMLLRLCEQTWESGNHLYIVCMSRLLSCGQLSYK